MWMAKHHTAWQQALAGIHVLEVIVIAGSQHANQPHHVGVLKVLHNTHLAATTEAKKEKNKKQNTISQAPQRCSNSPSLPKDAPSVCGARKCAQDVLDSDHVAIRVFSYIHSAIGTPSNAIHKAVALACTAPAREPHSRLLTHTHTHTHLSHQPPAYPQ